MTSDRVTAHYQAGRERGYGAQLTGARVNAVLDEAGLDGPRNINTGVSTVQPVYMVGQPPLDEIRNAVAGEAFETMFFAARDGNLVFLDSDHRSLQSLQHRPSHVRRRRHRPALPQRLRSTTANSFLTNEWTVTRPGRGRRNADSQGHNLD